jgi:hypothetical protein
MRMHHAQCTMRNAPGLSKAPPHGTTQHCSGSGSLNLLLQGMAELVAIYRAIFPNTVINIV